MLARAAWARVYSFADNRALVAEMLALERAMPGRPSRGHLGHWTAYQPRQAAEMAAAGEAFQGRFELVEGRVLDAAEVRGRGYLNFRRRTGASDFTASLAPEVLRRFAVEGIALADYRGPAVAFARLGKIL